MLIIIIPPIKIISSLAEIREESFSLFDGVFLGNVGHPLCGCQFQDGVLNRVRIREKFISLRGVC